MNQRRARMAVRRARLTPPHYAPGTRLPRTPALASALFANPTRKRPDSGAARPRGLACAVQPVHARTTRTPRDVAAAPLISTPSAACSTAEPVSRFAQLCESHRPCARRPLGSGEPAVRGITFVRSSTARLSSSIVDHLYLRLSCSLFRRRERLDEVLFAQKFKKVRTAPCFPARAVLNRSPSSVLTTCSCATRTQSRSLEIPA